MDAEKITPEQKKKAIAVWHDSDTADKKIAAVKAFPFLRDIYSEARHLVVPDEAESAVQ